ncbi:MAG TPA: multidrug ABC transporter ATP-binding protein, partial [Lachnospiraceae bacterium]|nr:multidrug ABC transporter ATP-binding protein [Lachnospiraceae bacterium]
MFKTLKQIIDWCGEFKGKLYIGFVFSFFSHLFAAMPVMVAAYTVGLLLTSAREGNAMNGMAFEKKWAGISLWIIALLVILRFFFDYMRSRFQEAISYELVAKDRLAIGDALKRVSLGYFQKNSTGDILNSITTGLNTLENMGIRMIDNFVGGYLNFLVIFLSLLVFSPPTALIALVGAAVSLLFLLLVSKHSVRNAPKEAEAGRKLSGAVLEYARGLTTVKSFGQGGTSQQSMKEAVRENRDVRLAIEYEFTPANCGHLLALKTASVFLAAAACFLVLAGSMDMPVMLMFVFFSFGIFGSLEPVSDSAHVLGIIGTAMDQIDALKEGNYIDRDGKDIAISNFGIEFCHVDFGYDEGNTAGRTVLKNVSFSIPEKTSTAIVGPSGSGKTTICNLIARFYDVQAGSIRMGGHDVREFTCDSLLKNMSMVFQNVYLFHDTIRNNIRFGRPDTTEEEVIAAAKAARCHDFIVSLPQGYDTVVGEGGGTLSGGEKQRISIARAMLKNAPVIILDEATASIDSENEHLIQEAISELTHGKTIITIAHRLATIENADQILVIDGGTVAQKGTHKELLEQEGTYREFVRIREQAEGWQIQ